METSLPSKISWTSFANSSITITTRWPTHSIGPTLANRYTEIETDRILSTTPSPKTIKSQSCKTCTLMVQQFRVAGLVRALFDLPLPNLELGLDVAITLEDMLIQSHEHATPAITTRFSRRPHKSPPKTSQGRRLDSRRSLDRDQPERPKPLPLPPLSSSPDFATKLTNGLEAPVRIRPTSPRTNTVIHAIIKPRQSSSPSFARPAELGLLTPKSAWAMWPTQASGCSFVIRDC